MLNPRSGRASVLHSNVSYEGSLSFTRITLHNRGFIKCRPQQILSPPNRFNYLQIESALQTYEAFNDFSER